MRMDKRGAEPAKLAMQFVRGFCMGVADIVPGVSGGTVALIFGIYQRLVANIHTGARALGQLVRFDGKQAVARLREVEWSFLLPLLVGVGVAFLSLAHLIEELLHDYPEEMAGLFLGLVAASVVIAWRQVERWDPASYALLVGIAVVSFIVLGFQSGAIDDPSAVQWFLAGAIAICAMILPGISGSFLLLMMGMYAPLLAAVNDRSIPEVAIFMVGATVGLALFSTLLSWLLAHHGNRVLAALIGLMIGSVRVLWPWPNGVGIISDEETEAISGTDLGWPETGADFAWPAILAVAAFVAVTVISVAAERRGPGAPASPEPSVH